MRPRSGAVGLVLLGLRPLAVAAAKAAVVDAEFAARLMVQVVHTFKFYNSGDIELFWAAIFKRVEGEDMQDFFDSYSKSTDETISIKSLSLLDEEISETLPPVFKEAQATPQHNTLAIGVLQEAAKQVKVDEDLREKGDKKAGIEKKKNSKRKNKNKSFRKRVKKAQKRKQELAMGWYNPMYISEGKLVQIHKPGPFQNFQLHAPEVPKGVRWLKVAAGRSHFAAMSSENKVYQWGIDLNGHKCGTTIAGLGGPDMTIAAGLGTTALLIGGSPYIIFSRDCAGSDGDDEMFQLSSPILPMDVTFQTVVLGDFHAAAISSDGELHVWGDNSFGQVSGRPNLTQGVWWLTVTAGLIHTAAISSDGALHSWGDDSFGQKSMQPNLAEGVKWMNVAAGDFHTAAVSTDGALHVWGFERAAMDVRAAPPTLGTGVRWKTARGQRRNVAVASDGAIHIWAHAKEVPAMRKQPILAEGARWLAVNAGGEQTIALDSNGSFHFGFWVQ